MNETPVMSDAPYYQDTQTFHQIIYEDQTRWVRRALVLSTTLLVITLLSVASLLALVPLKTVEPYVVIVDKIKGEVDIQRQTQGDVETLGIEPALSRSYLVKFVRRYERFYPELDIADDYAFVKAFANRQVFNTYNELFVADDETVNRFKRLKNAQIKVVVKSVTLQQKGLALIRFSTQTIKNDSVIDERDWVSTVTYRYRATIQDQANNWLNPLGFVVTQYRKSPERLNQESNL